MPFSFKTYVGVSALHGNGLYTAEDIPKGSVLWTFTARPESKVPEGAEAVLENTVFYGEEDFAKMPEEEIKNALEHAWAHPQTQKMLLMVDGCEWINHSETPNSQYVSQPDYRDAYSIALRDIRAGEEIVENYENYKKSAIPWVRRYLQKYNIGRFQLEESIGNQ